MITRVVRDGGESVGVLPELDYTQIELADSIKTIFISAAHNTLKPG